MSANPCIRLKRRPQGVPAVEDFSLSEADMPDSGVLCRSLYLSLDPYLRGRLSGRHLSGPIMPGDVMSSEAVLEVLEESERFKPGDTVRAQAPWQAEMRIPEASLTLVPVSIQPPSLALGVLGMPGLTAYAGVERYLKPQVGETLLVSAAAGPVGSTVAQLGKLAGARVVGLAGSEEKCGWLRGACQLDAVINYKHEQLREALERTCPQGINMYFDNVGGSVLAAAMERLALGARVVLCGLMAQYNEDSALAGPNPGLIIRARACVQGLVVYDHEDLRDKMRASLMDAIQEGCFQYREELSDGLESAPEAFCRLMRGENFGKTLVRVR